MHAVNAFKIDRHPDHFAVRFGLSNDPTNGELGEEVAAFVLPLTAALALATALFENVQKATPELQKAFEALQVRVNSLNVGGGTKL